MCSIYILPLLKLFPKTPYIENPLSCLQNDLKAGRDWEGHNAFNIPKMHCTSIHPFTYTFMIDRGLYTQKIKQIQNKPYFSLLN